MKFRENWNSEAMNLYQIFSDRRYIWQETAVNKIYESLIPFQSINNLQNNDTAERLVVTCGLPQSGKTELILMLIGVKFEYTEYVYKITRANQSRGTSSTATAISYHRADRDRFGVLIESISNSDEAMVDIRWFDDNEIIDYLTNLRKNVEAGAAKEDILHLFIPSKYFDQSAQMMINIVDLPGLKPSNTLEAPYVERIARKYLPLASVVLIVSPTYMVERLEDSEFNDALNNIIPNWKIDDNRFIVVVTQAYSGSSILKADKEKSDNALCARIRERCVFETQRHLGNNEIEVFPIELGDSLRQIDKYDSLSKIKEQVIEECVNTLKILNESIFKHKQKAPLRVIHDWEKQTKYLFKIKENESKRDLLRIEDLKKHREDELLLIKNKYDQLEKKINEKEKAISELPNNLKCRYDNVFKLNIKKIDNCIKQLKDEFWYIQGNKSDNKYINKQHIPKFLRIIASTAEEVFSDFINEYEELHRVLKYETVFSIDDLVIRLNRSFSGGILGAKFCDCVPKTESETFGFFKNGLDTMKNYAGTFSKALLVNANKELNELRSNARKYERTIKDIDKEIKSYEKSYASKKNEFYGIAKQYKYVEHAFNLSVDIINEAYKKECMIIENELLFEQINAEDKMQLLMLLMLIRWDYIAIIQEENR